MNFFLIRKHFIINFSVGLMYNLKETRTVQIEKLKMFWKKIRISLRKCELFVNLELYRIIIFDQLKVLATPYLKQFFRVEYIVVLYLGLYIHCHCHNAKNMFIIKKMKIS